MQICQLTTIDGNTLEGLNALLHDCVNNGASIGFIIPLSNDTTHHYWSQVSKALEDSLYLWIAKTEGQIVGSVQLNVCTKDNGRHRAELQKLMVLSSARQQGIGKQLLEAAEHYAKNLGLRLLVLDTEQGSTAELIYPRLGWEKAGVIPDYAITPNGRLHPTVYYFKRLPITNSDSESLQ
ncbi:GNAT family N-acetyltransferase [Thiofilum flexile]|uniref:GNAT family N-acetyltransferase n=1 Tax=Thiofilum flexile TaxID=125627 RepID=UPI00036C1C54|nr:GNAT family N-acetyltransferase [Thiofilum flexile]